MRIFNIFRKRPLQKISLVPKGLRYKLMIVFCLMSVIPMLVMGYIAHDYIFNVFVHGLSREGIFELSDIVNISWVLFISLVIVFLGLILARQMIEPIIEMAIEAKLIAEGDLNRRIRIYTEDEIGGLGHAINALTTRIKRDMEDLTSFGEKTKLLNIEIHRRVLALSSLLQIGENISISEHVDNVMAMIVDKVVQIMDMSFAMMFLPESEESHVLELRFENSVTDDRLRQLKITLGRDILGNALVDGKDLRVDSTTRLSKEIRNFRENYGAVNFYAIPVISRGRSVGMILVGNDIEDFVFKEEDLELLRILAKQAAIAYESDILLKKTRELAIKDDLTGLYNEKFITARLDEEIKRAVLYQRPCSYIALNIDDFDIFRRNNGELATEKALKKIANILQENVTQIGRAARLSGEGFALLLPEKNKKEAYMIAEEVRKRVENIDIDLELDRRARLTISGGVSENPLDGATAQELIKRATDSVLLAKSQGKNRVC